MAVGNSWYEGQWDAKLSPFQLPGRYIHAQMEVFSAAVSPLVKAHLLRLSLQRRVPKSRVQRDV